MRLFVGRAADVGSVHVLHAAFLVGHNVVRNLVQVQHRRFVTTLDVGFELEHEELIYLAASAVELQAIQNFGQGIVHLLGVGSKYAIATHRAIGLHGQLCQHVCQATDFFLAQALSHVYREGAAAIFVAGGHNRWARQVSEGFDV